MGNDLVGGSHDMRLRKITETLDKIRDFVIKFSDRNVLNTKLEC